MAARHTSNRNPDGNIVGQDPQDKVGFYGAAPVVRPQVAASPTVQGVVDALKALGLISQAS